MILTVKNFENRFIYIFDQVKK